MSLIDSYKNSKKANWIRRQLAQGMIVLFWDKDGLFVIKSVEPTQEGLIAHNKTKKIKLEDQILYATKADPTNPIGKFENKALEIPEYVDLILQCI